MSKARPGDTGSVSGTDQSTSDRGESGPSKYFIYAMSMTKSPSLKARNKVIDSLRPTIRVGTSTVQYVQTKQSNLSSPFALARHFTSRRARVVPVQH